MVISMFRLVVAISDTAATIQKINKENCSTPCKNSSKRQTRCFPSASGKIRSTLVVILENYIPDKYYCHDI